MQPASTTDTPLSFASNFVIYNKLIKNFSQDASIVDAVPTHDPRVLTLSSQESQGWGEITL